MHSICQLYIIYIIQLVTLIFFNKATIIDCIGLKTVS